VWCCCAAAGSQLDSGIGDVCTLPLDRSLLMQSSRLMENGHLSQLTVPVRPPTMQHLPIRVDELEDYIMARRNNNSEQLRNEYRVTATATATATTTTI